jgi:hypothetical protein
MPRSKGQRLEAIEEGRLAVVATVQRIRDVVGVLELGGADDEVVPAALLGQGCGRRKLPAG